MNIHPDRPLPGWKTPLRYVVRQFRLLSIRFNSQCALTVGRNVTFGRGCFILSPEFAKFGNNIRVGAFMQCETNLVVGDDTLISSRVAFVANDHQFEEEGKTVFLGGRTQPVTVILEGDNLLGFGATIIGGVQIGKGCIVGAR